MATRSEVFVVLPAFNEGRVLQATLQPLLGLGYSIVVVDDGSTDNTGAVLEGLPVHILRHPVNRGQGAALQTGMTYALRQGAQVIVHFDADGQHDAGEIAALIEPVLREEADVVLGSRFLRPADRRRIPPLKRLVLRAAVLFSGLFSGLWLSDTHNGFRALSREAAGRLHLSEDGFAHATEILAQIRSAGLRCVERPTTVLYTPYSRAKGQPVLNSLGIFFDLMLRRLFR